jgi:hypothetical protein
MRPNSESELSYDRRSVGQSISVSTTHLGPKIRFLLLSDSCGFVDVGRCLWQEDGSVIYNCCWSSPAQPFSGQNSAGLMPIFHCLRLGTPPAWRARSPYIYPPGIEWPSSAPRHWVPFYCLLRLPAYRRENINCNVEKTEEAAIARHEQETRNCHSYETAFMLFCMRRQVQMFIVHFPYLKNKRSAFEITMFCVSHC